MNETFPLRIQGFRLPIAIIHLNILKISKTEQKMLEIKFDTILIFVNFAYLKQCSPVFSPK